MRTFRRGDPTSSPRRAFRKRSIREGNTALRVSGSNPNPSYSMGVFPVPMAISSRPEESRSRRANSSARATGSCRGRTVTRDPRRMRRVTWEAAASHTGGAGRLPAGWKWCSAAQNVWYPRRSASWTSSSASV